MLLGEISGIYGRKTQIVQADYGKHLRKCTKSRSAEFSRVLM